MAQVDTPGAQRAISETTPLKVGLGRAAGLIASIVFATATATACALSLINSVADLKKAGEVQAVEMTELRAEVHKLRSEVSDLRAELHHDHSGRGDLSVVAPVARQAGP